MMRQATRIRDRAIRRCGELLKQIEPASGKRTDRQPAAASDSRLSRGEVARQAGMSERQQVTAIRVANVPTAARFSRSIGVTVKNEKAPRGITGGALTFGRRYALRFAAASLPRSFTTSYVIF